MIFGDILFRGKIPYLLFWKKVILFSSAVPIIGIIFLASDYRNLGAASWGVLLVIVFLRPLGDIFVDFKIFRAMLSLRKELGILCGSLGVSHGIGYFLDSKIPVLQWFVGSELWDMSKYYFWGILGFFMATILTLTSNIFSVKILKKYWKKLHKITYAFVFVVVIHIVLIRAEKAGSFWDFDVWGDILLVFGLFILWFLSIMKVQISFARFLFKKASLNNQLSVLVDRENCIGCTNCTRVCPNVFVMKEGKSMPMNPPNNEENEMIQMAIDQCPVNVISWEGGETETEEAQEQKLIFKFQQKLNAEVSVFTFSHLGLKFIPGQFLTLIFEEETGKFPRSYSIFSADEKTVTFCIRLLPEGKGSQKLKKLAVNDVVLARGPFGNIQLQNTNYLKVFIGTGTGISPLLCMIKVLPETVQKALFFGVRSERDIFLWEELKNIQGLFLSYSLSRPSKNWKGEKGRVTDHIIRSEFPKETEFYICGNPKMVDSVRVILKEKKVPDNKVFFEQFS